MKNLAKIILRSLLIAIALTVLSLIFNYEFLDSLIMGLVISGFIAYESSEKIKIKFNKIAQTLITFIFICSVLSFFIIKGMESLLYVSILSILASCILTILIFSDSLRKKMRINFEIDNEMLNGITKFSLIFLIALASFILLAGFVLPPIYQYYFM